MLAARVTLPLFSFSSAMTFAKSAGGPASIILVKHGVAAFDEFRQGMKDIIFKELGRSHPGAQQPIIQLSDPSANLPAHVHLYQRELLEILRIHLVEVGG